MKSLAERTSRRRWSIGPRQSGHCHVRSNGGMIEVSERLGAGERGQAGEQEQEWILALRDWSDQAWMH